MTPLRGLSNPPGAAGVAAAEALMDNPLILEAAGAAVLVTGAGGMVGAAVANAFLAAERKYGLGMRLYGMGRNAATLEKRFAGTALVPLASDVASPFPPASPRFDYIFHAASPAGPSLFARHPAEVVRANLAGTVNLLEKARLDRCRRFLFVSTHEVYGTGKDVWREEDAGVLDFLDPRACYPESKWAGENACVSYGKEYGIHTGIARLSRLYGPSMNLESGLFVCDFVKDVLAGRPVTVKHGPGLLRPLCHIDDAADALVRILFRGTAGAAYNVAPDEAWTIGEIAVELGRLGGTGHVLPEGGPTGGARQDTTHLKGLGWLPRVGLAEGLRGILE